MYQINLQHLFWFILLWLHMVSLLSSILWIKYFSYHRNTMRFDNTTFVLLQCTAKIVGFHLDIRWQFQAAGAGLGKFGPIRGCRIKRSAKSWIPSKITRNNIPKKKFLMNGPVTYTKPSMKFILIYIFVALVSLKFCK